MINVELKGGAVKEFENGTTPAEIAKSIGAGWVLFGKDKIKGQMEIR